MTTEEDFQAALDANPEDWQTRLVFADWLQERGDPRAAGYRALGVLRRVPSDPEWGFLWSSASQNRVSASPVVLPRDWYDFLDNKDESGQDKATIVCPELILQGRTEARRAREDKAALAFARLPPKRQHKLLSTKPPEPRT